MKTKKKAKPLSRLDKQGVEVAAQSKALVDTGHRITRLEFRVDKVDSSLARELFAIREAFQLTDEWRNRALKAEHALSLGAAVDGEALNKLVNDWSARAVKAEQDNELLEIRLKAINSTFDQFKREDEARAETIREIVRPLGFEYFAPMDAVREMAKLTFSLRDELEARVKGADERCKILLDAKDKWSDRSRAAEAELTSLRAAKEKSNLDKQPAVQEERPLPDCGCVGSWRIDHPHVRQEPHGNIGIWGDLVYAAQGGCNLCGGTGYRRKDSPGPLPPDAAQSATSPSRLDVGQFRATEGELKEALKLWHEGKVCTCSGGQQHHRAGNSECYYEPRKEEVTQDRCSTCGGGGKYRVVAASGQKGDWKWCPDCGGSGKPRKEDVKEKPLRLLVEIVSKKDRNHLVLIGGKASIQKGNGFYPFWVQITPVSETYEKSAMSVQELPEIPRISDLCRVYGAARIKYDLFHDCRERCLRDVLAACGLEVSE